MESRSGKSERDIGEVEWLMYELGKTGKSSYT
jgi:hypothetical protein